MDENTRFLDNICGGIRPLRRGPVRQICGKPEADSRQVVPGSIFAAIPGTRVDGHDFIADAIRRGAQIIFHSRPLKEYPAGITFFQCQDIHRVYAGLCAGYFNDPQKKLELYGVTGTNGKTTTVYLLKELFARCGAAAGYLSTVEFCDGRESRPATHTTPDTGTLYQMLGKMRDNGVQKVAMELSSHALDQHRAAGLKFRCAIFTNLTGDHLDYHGDMENYFQCKKRLFTEYICGGGAAVINLDDSCGERLAAGITDPGIRVCGFSTVPGRGTYLLRECRTGSAGSTFVIDGGGVVLPVNCSLCGMHNIYNAAGAIIAVLAGGMPPELLIPAVKRLELQVPGRLEQLISPAGAGFYIDYAHTHDALRRVLEALRPVTEGRLIVLFGAGGDRDRTKRPKMGRAAAAGADYIILTSDNPRSEDPAAIMEEVASGIPDGFPCRRLCDRREALRYAVSLAGAGDTVLVAGKGHEDYQEISGTKYHFSDREILLQTFQESKK